MDARTRLALVVILTALAIAIVVAAVAGSASAGLLPPSSKCFQRTTLINLLVISSQGNLARPKSEEPRYARLDPGLSLAKHVEHIVVHPCAARKW